MIRHISKQYACTMPYVGGEGGWEMTQNTFHMGVLP